MQIAAVIWAYDRRATVSTPKQVFEPVRQRVENQLTRRDRIVPPLSVRASLAAEQRDCRMNAFASPAGLLILAWKSQSACFLAR